MLDSLYIRNFRNLKELEIKTVDQVNLITGKNNTGKSSILEAIAIYASCADIELLFQLLAYRGENYSRNSTDQDTNSRLESNIHSLSSLFMNRNIGYSKNDAILIGDSPQIETEGDYLFEKFVTLQFAKYYERTERDEDGITISRKRILLSEQEAQEIQDYLVGLEISCNQGSYLIPLSSTKTYMFSSYKFNAIEKFQLIRTDIDREINSKLFDNIALTEKERYVFEALQIIEPSTERIAFVEDNRRRIPVIKLSNSQEVLPLFSMGDGINRILTIILAMVNAENGYLLIDEFENGLHYSVQEQLWKIIFRLSKKLNVQVFATTHSNDCIAGFEKELNSTDNTTKGRLIRLDNKNGKIQPVEYSPSELKIANEHNIETR